MILLKPVKPVPKPKPVAPVPVQTATVADESSNKRATKLKDVPTSKSKDAVEKTNTTDDLKEKEKEIESTPSKISTDGATDVTSIAESRKKRKCASKSLDVCILI